jgi:hypothetical protein
MTTVDEGRPDTAAEWTAHARTAGASGVVFAGLLTASLVLVRQGPGLADPDAAYAAFYASGAQSLLVTVGLYLVPFAGIAFLWHMIAVRMLVPHSPSVGWWLQLASGVLFVAMLFIGTAAVGGVALLGRFSTVPASDPDVARALAGVGYATVFVFGVRAAGMYMITTTGLARRAGAMPGPLALVGYLAAAFLLVSTTFHPAIMLVFPGWVLLVSVLLLVRRPDTGTV